jgi:hypothetical protein
MPWYRVVGLPDTDSGDLADVLQAFPETPSYPYVSASLLQPYGGGYSERDLPERITALPYGMGYSALDSSPEVQRAMAEQRTLKHLAPPGGTFPVYSQPSASSPIKGHYSEREDSWHNVLVAVDFRPGWLLVVDLKNHGPSGWVESGRLRVFEPDDGQSWHFDVGELVALNLGANVREIMRRWGPGTVVERFTGTDWEEDRVGSNTVAVLAFEGFRVEYNNYSNFSFTLTRPGAGLGGIFVGVDWCDKEYIDRVFGKILSKQVFTGEGGIESWRMMEGMGSGW